MECNAMESTKCNGEHEVQWRARSDSRFSEKCFGYFKISLRYAEPLMCGCFLCYIHEKNLAILLYLHVAIVRNDLQLSLSC